MTKIELQCKQCGIIFHTEQKEYVRQTKNGRSEDHWFCSRSCVRTYGNKNRPSLVQGKISRAIGERSLGNSYAKKGNFTYYLNKSRNRKHNYNLTEQYLQNLWNKQEGKCCFTGIQMSLHGRRKEKHPTTASLDRIDSLFGYIEGNVQFVCLSLNLAKNDFTNEEFIDFLNMLSPVRINR
jgi:hypothetical protein